MSYFLFLFIFLHISFMLAQLNESEISMFWEHKDWLEIKKPPKGPNGGPLIVKMGMYLESLGNFQEAKMSFEVDLYLYMSWRDPALKHNGTEMMMFNDDKIRQRIWLPDLYFTNARYAQFHDVTVPNFNLFIAPDGTVAYSTRVTLNVACNLNLKNYPMDKQSCTIRVTSYAYIASIVNVTWFAKYPLMYNHEIGLPEFTFIKVSAEYCDGTYRYAITENEYKQAEFSCLDGTLYLQRSLGFNMVQSYIPTGLIVIISWVSFWIDRRAVPARVTLSFTTLVSLTTIGNGMRFALPQVSYAKAIDYWFGACMLFLFLSLIEFALVNSYMRKSEKYERLSSKYLVEKGDMLILPSFQRTTNEMMKIRRQSSIATKQKFVNLWKRKVFERMSEESSITSPGISEHCASKVRFACETLEENSQEVETDQSEQDSLYDNLSPTSNDNNNLSNCNIGIDYKTPLKNSKFPKYDDSNHMRIKSQRHNGNINGTSISPNQLLSLQYLEVSQILSNRALQIDKISRYLFPIIFTCFNIIYWIYYLVYQK